MNPFDFSQFEKHEVIGMLKATGTRDKDVLYAEKLRIQRTADLPKKQASGTMLMGLLLTITGIGAVLGIPTIIFGWWWRRRAVNNIKTVEAVYAEFVSGL